MNTTIRVMLKEPFEYIQTDLDIEVQLEPDGYIIESVDAEEAFDKLVEDGFLAEIRPGLFGDPSYFDGEVGEIPVRSRQTIVEMLESIGENADDEIDFEELQQRYDDEYTEDYDDTEEL